MTEILTIILVHLIVAVVVKVVTKFDSARMNSRIVVVAVLLIYIVLIEYYKPCWALFQKKKNGMATVSVTILIGTAINLGLVLWFWLNPFHLANPSANLLSFTRTLCAPSKYGV
ncbi:MAG: hypothetical protein U9P90_00810 [Patescibacteria group bacterium]|nr:hypothetical protein [Patescibacteria group bacterium]